MQASYSSNHTSTVRSNYAGVTEILINDQQAASVILPMLSFLSHRSEPRWLTWLTDSPIKKSMLADHSFNLAKIRLIYPGNSENRHELLKTLLSNGTSHCVFSSTPYLSPGNTHLFERAAQKGQSQAILLRYRY